MNSPSRAQTVSNAVEKRENATALIARCQADFASVLPSHVRPETFVRLSQGLLRRDKTLQNAAVENPNSLLAALLECARLGHEPGTDQYALTCFQDNRSGLPEVVGIEQYQGEIERMYRAGAVTSVKCNVVRVNDYYEYDEKAMLRPDYRPGWYCSEPPGQHRHARFLSEKDRGELSGVYAYAEFRGGAVSYVVEMGRSEVMKHKAVAKTKKFWEGDWEQSMWKKTAIHELEKWVPTSAEYHREQLRAAAEADAIRRAAPEPDVRDAEVVVDDANPRDAEAARG